jgi:hypothetical protein
VAADIGNSFKTGEASEYAAVLLGVPSSPTTGGDPTHVYEYHLWPEVPAIVDGITYDLQHS